MPDATDMELVWEFARRHSEAAFTELVRRHLALVYSVARRFTGNVGDAQDVAQAVFIILARKAAGLHPRTLLAGWLYETTRLTAARLRRDNARRRRREQEAYMQSTLNETDPDGIWKQLSPWLEAAMSHLAERDRALLVLRFYENKSGPESAALLGIREDAAQKRASRAIEKLRKFFAQRGVTLSGEAITRAVAAHSVQTPPAALAGIVTAAALAQGATASASSLTLVKGALKLMAWAKAKTAMVIGAGVLLAAGTATVTVTEMEAPATLVIRMHVDGTDVVRVSGNRLWIEHGVYLLPDGPIYVNGRRGHPRGATMSAPASPAWSRRSIRATPQKSSWRSPPGAAPSPSNSCHPPPTIRRCPS